MQGETPSLDDVLAHFEKTWTDRQPLTSSYQEGKLSFDQITWGDKSFPDYTADETFADGLEMLRHYYPYMKWMKPKHVEYAGEVPIEDDEVQFHVDYIGGSFSAPDGNVLVDFKTGRRTRSPVEVDTSIQLSAYAWGLRKTGIWQPEDEYVEIHSIVRLKKSKRNPDPYKVSIIKSRRNMLNFEFMEELFIPRQIAMKKAGIYPAGPGLHCAWCQMQQQCPHWESIMQGREDRRVVANRA
jgi:hypothetical protein